MATPSARALAERASDDAPRDEGFGAVLDARAQSSKCSPANGSAKSAAGARASDGPRQGAATGIEALLAKLSKPTTPGAANSKKGGEKGLEAGDATSGKRATTEIATETSSAASADPLAAMAALLPGVAAATAGTPAVQATDAKVTEAGPNLGAAALAKAVATKTSDSKASDSKTLANSDPSSSSVDVAFIGTAGHLAPSLPQGAGASAAAGSTAKASPDQEAVVSVASHEQPDATLTDATFQTIAGAVTTLAGEAAAVSDSTPAAALPSDPMSPSLAPSRSLTLQLTPGDLGSVTVRLHLSGDGLDVHLAVEDHKTLAAITHARGELTAAIGDNGYQVGSLVIQGADASSTSTAGSNDSARSRSEAGQSFSGSGSGGDASSQRQHDTGPRDTRPSESGGDRGAGGVFV